MPGIGVISGDELPGGAGRLLAYVVGEPGSGARERGLDEVALELHERDVDVICLGGGDRVRHRALSALAGAWRGAALPVIAVLDGGLPARNLGLRARPAEVLARVIQGWHAGRRFQVAEVDTVEVAGNVGFVFGTGLVASFLEELVRRGAGTVAAASLLVAKAAGSALAGGVLARGLYERRRVRVTADGDVWPTERFSALVAGTLPRVPLGFRPLFRAGELPRSFHLLGAACAPGDLAVELPSLRLGRPLSRRKMIDAVAREATLASDRRWRYTIDGALYESDETLRLTVGPRVRIIVR